MNNVMFYNSFKKAFSTFYESEEYDRVLFICSECCKKIYGGTLSFKDKMMFINGFFRNEKNKFSKTIGTLDILMPSDSFETILEKHEIDTDEFINMFNKYLLMIKLNKPSSDENKINEILTKLQKFYGIENKNLCILKIYEIQALKELTKEKTLN